MSDEIIRILKYLGSNRENSMTIGKALGIEHKRLLEIISDPSAKAYFDCDLYMTVDMNGADLRASVAGKEHLKGHIVQQSENKRNNRMEVQGWIAMVIAILAFFLSIYSIGIQNGWPNLFQS